MKPSLLIILSLAFTLKLNAQTNYDETEPIANIPLGILYQTGQGANNTLNWTYAYSTKLTVNSGISRNFELSSTGKDNEGFVVRQFSESANSWTGWKKILLDDTNGNVRIENGAIISGTDYATSGALQFAGKYYDDNILNTYGSQYSSGATSIGYGVKQKSGSEGFVSSAGNSAIGRGMLMIDSELEFLTAPQSTVAIDGDIDLNSRFIVKSNGNVGVGTSAPDARLAVNGTIHTKEVRVDLNGWPDFVFESHYQLRSLDNVEKFIKEHKHLPAIPSSREVEENGVNLGEMEAKLLQKVEELTLYMIEQNKRIEKLEKENELLKAKLDDL